MPCITPPVLLFCFLHLSNYGVKHFLRLRLPEIRKFLLKAFIGKGKYLGRKQSCIFGAVYSHGLREPWSG